MDKENKIIDESTKAFREMSYSIKSFSRAVIHAKNATDELFKIYDRMEQIKKDKRRLKRKEIIEKLKFWNRFNF